VKIRLKDTLKNIPFRIIGNANAIIHTISIDSRSLQNNKNTLFFALKGNHNDAHTYIYSLLERGIESFVVSKIPQNTDKGNYILVENVLEALQNFAINYRQHFNFPIIGITGSNGKTIVKEWLNFLLAPDYNIVRNPKSYNSQIGVPFSILGINQYHNFGIFEAGISQVNEMQKLQEIIRPTIGILTNIGDAHNEGFSTKNEKISEKIKLFLNAKVVIFQKNKDVDLALNKYDIQRFSWSFSDKLDSIFIKKTSSENTTFFEFNFENQDFKVEIPFTDDASIENAVNSMMVLLYLQYDKSVVRSRMKELYPIEMRLKVKNGINNTTLIDDSYISDFQSLKIALDFLEQQKQHTKKTVILSDILQSGEDENELYKKVAELLTQNYISEVIGIGKNIATLTNYFKNTKIFRNTKEFLNEFNRSNLSNQTILIKGARSFHLEEIVSVLEEKTHQTFLEINLNAITHNLNYFKSKLNSTTKIMVMLKAFGYGSGSFEIAKLLEYHKVDYIGVAFTDEGIALHRAGISVPIMVMNPEPSSFSALISSCLEPEIYSLEELRIFCSILEKNNIKKYPIHLKLDTGMHRLGFEEKDLQQLINYLQENNHFFDIKSIFSHLSASDSEEFSDFTLQQFQLFKKLSDFIKKELKISPICHICNTSAISNYPQMQMDMVRLGIGLYGISNDEIQMKYLENVSTLKSVILQIKEIKIGESIGYSRGFIAKKTMRTATIPIGYADGIPRVLSQKSYVLINEQKAPIIGSICMDMLMVDVSEIVCNQGDTVIIFGENPKVTEIAKYANTIAYEIVTGISQRVKRVFCRE